MEIARKKKSGKQLEKAASEAQFVEGSFYDLLDETGAPMVGYKADLSGTIISFRGPGGSGERKTPVVVEGCLFGKYRNRQYRRVMLSHLGKRTNFLLARLILSTFVRPPEEGEIVLFRDDDPTNCAVANLEWTTRGAKK